jgi:ADP-ribosylarginine hydrolase
MSKEIEEKYISTMLLHALGDTIGFKNGEWEFYQKNNLYGSTLEKLYEFIDLGGINHINLKNWIVSDDTILHMAIARSLLMPYNNFDDLENNTVKMIVKSNDVMQNDIKNNKNRYIGNSVEKHSFLLKENNNWKNFEFDKMGGGNGASMRNNCIGLAFFGKNNRDKLINYAINSSKMTHVNPIGWLGGLSTALFTSFILEDINIQKWIPEMLQIIESENVKKYLNPNNKEEQLAFDEFVQCWKTYYESRFIRGKLIKPKSHSNLIQRLIFYNNIFDINPLSKMGLSGYAAVIVAYDCLLDSGNNWEKLVIYSMINVFDSDTIGAIAGGLFGTLYGMKNVPNENLKYLEFKDNLIKIGKLLYKKYFKNEKILV